MYCLKQHLEIAQHRNYEAIKSNIS